MAQVYDNDDDNDEPEFDESQCGPEYWLNKHAKYRNKQLSRCLKCGMKQELLVDDDGVWSICPNAKCKYYEAIINWKV